MRLYDSDGQLIRKKGITETYYYHDNKLTPTPYYNSDKGDIVNFLVSCMRDVISDITVNDVLTAWDYYESKKNLILSYLMALKGIYKNLGDKRRELAYKNAAQSVEKSIAPITSRKQALKLRGIGDGIAKKIEEIVTTGRLDIDWYVQYKTVLDQIFDIINSKNNKFDLITYLSNRLTSSIEKSTQIAYKLAISEVNKIENKHITEQQQKDIINNIKNIIGVHFQSEIDKYLIVAKFEKIWGVGPVNAIKIYDKGYRTIDELITASSLYGMGYTSLETVAPHLAHLKNPNLSFQSKIGLKYYYELSKRIPREDIEYAEPMLRSVLHSIDKDAKFCVCGSYRRLAMDSGDIDILISSKKFTSKELLKKYIYALRQKNFITDDLSKDIEKTYMGVALIKGVHRRIDIKFIPPKNWGTGVVHYTGSDNFNKAMRAKAREMGYTLSEYRMKELISGDEIEFDTEKAVFDFLGLDYLPPEKRY